MCMRMGYVLYRALVIFVPGSKFLKQARAPGFLELLLPTSVCMCVCVHLFMCMCVCMSTPEAMNNYWHDVA